MDIQNMQIFPMFAQKNKENKHWMMINFRILMEKTELLHVLHYPAFVGFCVLFIMFKECLVCTQKKTKIKNVHAKQFLLTLTILSTKLLTKNCLQFLWRSPC